MRAVRWSPLVALALSTAVLAGCASHPAPPAAAPAAAEPVDPWGAKDRVVLVHADFDGLETDLPLCLNGGASTTASEFRRSEETVHNGTAALEVTVSTGDDWPGLQVGYLHDGDKDYTWLPTVHGAAQTFRIPVSPALWEDAADVRWHFNHRDNLPGPAQQECWTGGGKGTWSVEVAAVRGASPS